MRKTDAGCFGKKSKKGKNDDCDKPTCVPAKKFCGESHCEAECKNNCKDNCKINYRKCTDKYECGSCDSKKSKGCTSDRCEIRCKEPYECDCKDSKYLVKVDVCTDLCKDEACCGSCSKGGACEDEVCATDSCEDFEFCDAVTVLKDKLCLSNTMEKVSDVRDRYTGFYNHFNRCLDCKYPRGVFQAWAMCEDYEKPGKPSRIIDNNSELLALDHILVSDCLNVTCATLSDLCIEKCGVEVGVTPTDLYIDGRYPLTSTLSKMPFVQNGKNFSRTYPPGFRDNAPHDFPLIPDYSGSVVKSFFTHRLYCVNIELPCKKKNTCVESSESLHGLGLTSLWSALCTYAGTDCIDVSVFADFGLDKHAYFRDYFWSCITNKFTAKLNGLGDSYGDAEALIRKTAGCENEELMFCTAKNKCMCEDDFYKHMLCVLSNSDNRDRFVINVGVMEALYKVACMPSAMKDVLGDKCQISDVNELLCNVHLIGQLFGFLSKCFGDVMKSQNFWASISGDGLGTISEIMDMDTQQSGNSGSSLGGGVLGGLIGDGNDFCEIGSLLSILDYCMSSNCAVMEILTRYAVRSFGSGDCAENTMLFTMALNDKTDVLLATFVQMLCIEDDDVDRVICHLRMFMEGKMTAGAFVDAVVRMVKISSAKPDVNKKNSGSNVVLLLLTMIGYPFRHHLMAAIGGGGSLLDPVNSL